MKVISLFFYLCFFHSIACTEKAFVIIICSRNNEARVKENLDSVFNQQYKNFRVIYIDDASTDKTATLVKDYLTKNNKTHICSFISNPTRMYKMHNFYHAVHSCKDHEIVIELDGDDSFFDNEVLTYLNKIYQNNDVWLTYGGIVMKPHNLTSIKPKKIPLEMVKKKAFRNIMHEYWIFIALRSFYAGLFKKIEPRSLKYKGKFFERGSDMLQMIPLFEMAGERFHCIEQPVYIYHTDTGAHDYQQDCSMQSKASLFARHRKQYHRLKEAPFTCENQ